MERIRTFYGYPRVRDDRWVGRITLGIMWRCKKCGLYFWDAMKAKEHYDDPGIHRLRNVLVDNALPNKDAAD